MNERHKQILKVEKSKKRICIGRKRKMSKAAFEDEEWEEEEDDIEDNEERRAMEEYYSELSRKVMEEEMNIDYERVREEQPKKNIPTVTTIHPPLDPNNPFPEFAPIPLKQQQLLDIGRFHFVSDELYSSLYSAYMADDPFFTDFVADFSARHSHHLSIPASLRNVNGSEFMDLGKDSDLGFEDAKLKLDFDSKLVLENTKGSEGDELDKISDEFGVVEREITDDLGESMQVQDI